MTQATVAASSDHYHPSASSAESSDYNLCTVPYK